MKNNSWTYDEIKQMLLAVLTMIEAENSGCNTYMAIHTAFDNIETLQAHDLLHCLMMDLDVVEALTELKKGSLI